MRISDLPSRFVCCIALAAGLSTPSLCAAQGKSTQSINELVKILDDIDRSKPSKLKALSALGGQGPDALPVIQKYIDHPDFDFRLNALHALGRIGEPAIPDLLKIVTTKKDSTAVGYLGNMGPKAQSVVPALFKFVADNDEELIAVGALGAIDKIGIGADAKYVPDLIKILKNRDNKNTKGNKPLSLFWAAANRMYCCRIAVLLLGKLGPPAKDAVPQLTEMIKDGHKSPSGWPGGGGSRLHDVFDTLSKIGPDAKESVPTLRKFLNPPGGTMSALERQAYQKTSLLAEEAIAKIKK